jgi:hypothetical protein
MYHVSGAAGIVLGDAPAHVKWVIFGQQTRVISRER